MKKLFLISALTLMMSTALPVFATEITESSSTPAETVVKYGVEDSYTVTIPAEFTLTNTETTQSVSASDVYIPYGKTLKVTIESDNYANSSWNLVDKSNSSNKLAYTIGTATNLSDVASGAIVLEVSAGDVDGLENDLYFNLTSEPTIAGNYEDTLSFTVTVE